MANTDSVRKPQPEGCKQDQRGRAGNSGSDVAHPQGNGRDEGQAEPAGEQGGFDFAECCTPKNVPHSHSHSLEGLEPEPQPGGHGRPDRLYDREGGPRSGAEWPPEPGVGRVVNGMAARVDRLKAIGNGQVPRVAATAWALMSPVEVVQILSSDPLDASK